MPTRAAKCCVTTASFGARVSMAPSLSGASTVALKDPPQEARPKAIQPAYPAAAWVGDDFSQSSADGADGRLGDHFRRDTVLLGPERLARALDHVFEEFRLRGAGIDKQHVDSQGREFRSQCVREAA